MSEVSGIECLNCGQEPPGPLVFDGCPRCKTDGFVSNLAPQYDYSPTSHILDSFDDSQQNMWRYHDILPVDENGKVSIGEGGTPLVRTSRLGDRYGMNELFIKDESQNPTWSFKDRLSSIAISKAKEVGAETVTIASTGNHGASTAAYAANAGLDCVVFTIPEVSGQMQSLMQSYGGYVIPTPTPEDRWKLMRSCIDEFDWYPTGNYVTPPVGSNFYGIEGYKTIAYEIWEQLGEAVPEWVVKPTAFADGLSGIWQGFKELFELGLTEDLPRMVTVEPFGPLKNAYEKDQDTVSKVDGGSTIALSISTDISTYQGLKVLKESNGASFVCDDDDIREAQEDLAESSGILTEPTSAACLVGVRKLADNEDFDADDTVVAVNTSTGLKNQDVESNLNQIPTIDPEIPELEKTLQSYYDAELR